MRNPVSEIISAIADSLFPHAGPKESPVPSIKEAVEQAREDWQASRAYFDMVSEPELVDHAIYMMEAAQTRYSYLLKKAKELSE